jgi:hypothetical protein
MGKIYANPKISIGFKAVDRWEVLNRFSGGLAPKIHNICTT